MDCLLEALMECLCTPFCEVCLQAPAEDLEGRVNRMNLPKWLRVTLLTLIILLFFAAICFIVAGAILLATHSSRAQTITGAVLLPAGAVIFTAYIVTAVILYRRENGMMFSRKPNALPRTHARPDGSDIGRRVHVVVDRPLGTKHPRHDNIVYAVNYGYVPTVMGGDGQAQDAYILGADTPLAEFDGVVIAIIYREDDCEDKWIVTDGTVFTDDEIMRAVEFQEKFFKTEIIR